MKFKRDWKESWIDKMGLIVALDGHERFQKLSEFKAMLKELPDIDHKQVQEAIRLRFAPTNGENGCQSAMKSVKEVTA